MVYLKSLFCSCFSVLHCSFTKFTKLFIHNAQSLFPVIVVLIVYYLSTHPPNLLSSSGFEDYHCCHWVRGGIASGLATTGPCAIALTVLISHPLNGSHSRTFI